MEDMFEVYFSEEEQKYQINRTEEAPLMADNGYFICIEVDSVLMGISEDIRGFIDSGLSPCCNIAAYQQLLNRFTN